MHISSLNFSGFRNLLKQEIPLSEGVNLFIGNNAQGKTNAVEGAHLALRGHSFRTSEFRDMISWGCGFSAVLANVIQEKGSDKLESRLTEEKKEYYRNAKRSRPYGVGVVVFSPEAISFIRGGPSERRNYVDDFISQVESLYSPIVKKYGKIISQRNKILQDEEASPSKKNQMLEPWDMQLVSSGAEIISMRARWTARLNSFIPERYSHVAPSDGPARLIYLPKSVPMDVGASIADITTGLERALHERRWDEITRRISLVGPHRDDYGAAIGGHSSKQFGSQGQKRTFMLAMKMSEIDLITEVHGETPIFILDDVKGELDASRSEYLISYLSQVKGQALITTTDLEEVEALAAKSVFEVLNGSIVARK